jgi:hypothetical protein
MGTTCTDSGGAVCDGNGNCVQCNMPSDCAAQATLCKINTCTINACGVMNAAQGATCNDNGGTACNATGVCSLASGAACTTNGDCASGICMMEGGAGGTCM